MTKPHMVIIDEAKWCTGVRRDGDAYCALGFMLKAADVRVADVGRATQHEEYEALAGLAHTDWPNRVWGANDRLTGDARKLELTRLFREQGMALCFVDSSKPKVAEEPVKACTWVTA